MNLVSLADFYRSQGYFLPVRGEDRFGHFPHEPRPAADLDPAAIAAHRAALAPHAVERFSTI